MKINEIRENLRTNDEKLINEIYDIYFRKLSHCDKNTEVIDAKASSLIGLIGISLSLVFSIGGIIIEKITNVNLPLLGYPIPWLVLFYISSTITFIIALIFSYNSVRARSNWKRLGDEDIFKKDMIEAGGNTYKRYMITHVLKVYKNNHLINEIKGQCLKKAQLIFMAALLQLLPIVAVISLYALEKNGFING
jgi:hypothetical protein